METFTITNCTTTTCGTVYFTSSSASTWVTYDSLDTSSGTYWGGGVDFPAHERRQGGDLAAHPPAAKRRAARLLLENLDAEQRECLRRHGFFVVIGGTTGKRYRIRKGAALVANIDVLAANDNVEHRLCGHCDPKVVPLGDHLLAQKIMLECAEDEFLRIANRHAA